MGFFTFNLWPANTPAIHFEAKHDRKSEHRALFNYDNPIVFICIYDVERCRTSIIFNEHDEHEDEDEEEEEEDDDHDGDVAPAWGHLN